MKYALALALVLVGMAAFASTASAVYPPGTTPKVGDKVKITVSEWHPESVGKTGTVTRVSTPAEATAEVKIVNKKQWFRWSDLTPTGTPPPPPPPDGDGDGVPDSTDQCPTQAGPASNNGCPVTPPPPTGWNCSAGYVSLSFDDGPTGLTRQYADAVANKGAKAEFFFQGNHEDTRPSDVQYAANKGMIIENHSWDHTSFLSLSNAQVMDQLQRTKDITQQLTGQVQKVFRPPYGEYNWNTYGLGTNVGLNLVTWTYDTKDWQDPSVSTLVSRIVGAARDQAIILAHDGHPNTLAALPGALDGIKAKNLCVGKIVPATTSIPNEWGDPQYVKVVAF